VQKIPSRFLTDHKFRRGKKVGILTELLGKKTRHADPERRGTGKNRRRKKLVILTLSEVERGRTEDARKVVILSAAKNPCICLCICYCLFLSFDTNSKFTPVDIMIARP